MILGCSGGKGPGDLSKEERVRWERFRKIKPELLEVAHYTAKEGWYIPALVSRMTMGYERLDKRTEEQKRQDNIRSELQYAENLVKGSMAIEGAAVIDMTSQENPQVIECFYWEGSEVKRAKLPSDASMEKKLRAFLMDCQRKPDDYKKMPNLK
jgi:hypothetical protein